jgi:hypothetical protein
MAWPRCPACLSTRVVGVDRAEDLRDLGRQVGAHHEVIAEDVVHRSYRCECGWTGWSAEKLTSHWPDTVRMRRKFQGHASE